MATNMTDSYSIEQLNGLTGYAQLTTPATTYLALFTTDPTSSGSVANEVTNAGYVRVSLAGLFGSASSTSVSNSSDIAFAAATEDWATITHAGIMKSGTAGTADMMEVIPLDVNITILNGQNFKFTVGAFTLSTGCADAGPT